MKYLKLGALLGLVVVASILIPVSGLLSTTVFSAQGGVLTYYSPGSNDGGVPGAAVKGGDWSIAIKNVETRNVVFKLHYYEMNILPGEKGPFGSVDQFWITLVECRNVYFVAGDGWHVDGRFNVNKLAYQADGSTIMMYNFLGDQWGLIFIKTNGMLQFDAGPWHLIGYRTYNNQNNNQP